MVLEVLFSKGVWYSGFLVCFQGLVEFGWDFICSGFSLGLYALGVWI